MEPWEQDHDDEDEEFEEEFGLEMEAAYGQLIDDIVQAMVNDLDRSFEIYGTSPVAVLGQLTTESTPPDLPSYMLHEFSELYDREMKERAVAEVIGEARPESVEFREAVTGNYWDPEYREWRKNNPDKR